MSEHVMASRVRFVRPRVRLTSVQEPFGVHSGSIRGPFGFRSGFIWGLCGVRSGFVRDPCGLRSGSVRADFGPKFSDPKIQNFKNFQFVRPSPPWRGPSLYYTAVPSPAARRAPAAAAAGQIENFCEKVSEKSSKHCEQDLFRRPVNS